MSGIWYLYVENKIQGAAFSEFYKFNLTPKIIWLVYLLVLFARGNRKSQKSGVK